MSVNGERPQVGEFSEQIDFLQLEITKLSERLKSVTDEVERERLESLIGDVHAKIELN